MREHFTGDDDIIISCKLPTLGTFGVSFGGFSFDNHQNTHVTFSKLTYPSLRLNTQVELRRRTLSILFAITTAAQR